MQCLAYFLDKLRSTPDGDGTLLDHSLTLYGTNMGDSNQHLHYDVPHILAGGASGQLKGGRHLAFPTKTVTTGNLLLSILDMYGIHQDCDRRQHRRMLARCWFSRRNGDKRKCAFVTSSQRVGVVLMASLAAFSARQRAAPWPMRPRRAIKRRFAP